MYQRQSWFFTWWLIDWGWFRGKKMYSERYMDKPAITNFLCKCDRPLNPQASRQCVQRLSGYFWRGPRILSPAQGMTRGFVSTGELSCSIHLTRSPCLFFSRSLIKWFVVLSLSFWGLPCLGRSSQWPWIQRLAVMWNTVEILQLKVLAIVAAVTRC